MSRCGIAAAASHDSIPAPDLRSRVGQRLAHVAGDERGQLVLVREQDLAQRHHCAGTQQRRGARQVAAAVRAAATAGVDVGQVDSGTRASTLVAGSRSSSDSVVPRSPRAPPM
ncbi:MAG: hypothetical protein U0S48_12005 [Solirubrobacteraceae bacterium]